MYAMGVAFGLAILCGLTAAVIVASRKGSNSVGNGEEGKTSSPSQSPTTSLDTQYLTFFAKVLKNDKVLRLELLTIVQHSGLSPSASNLLQRFMMAFLWFHTTENGETEWKSCNPPREGESNTCVFSKFIVDGNLEDAYFEPIPDQLRWLSGGDECLWTGVNCAESPSVMGISLGKSIRRHIVPLVL